jgi:hypothetical protein
MILTGETEVLGKIPVPMPLYPPQIPHGLTWDRTWTSAVEGQRLSNIDSHLNCVYNYSPYRTVNKARAQERKQSVNIVATKNNCLLR